MADIEAAAYIDICPGATGCSTWRFPESAAITYGLDLGRAACACSSTG